MDELKPCPFCGGDAIVNVIEAHTHKFSTFMPDYAGSAFVECTKCTCAISAQSEQEAIDTWNKQNLLEQLADAQCRAQAAVEDMEYIHWAGRRYGCKICLNNDVCNRQDIHIGPCADFDWRGPQGGEKGRS